MNYPRVNLLKKSEQRYQGVVSRRFILISAVVTPVLLIALLSGIKLIQYAGVQSELKASRDIWKDMEPRLALYKEESRILASNRKTLELFDGWQRSQLPLLSLLNEIQDVVPGNIQFSRLSLKGDVAPGMYERAEDMQMMYRMQVDGSAEGDRAEEEVWKFHRDLLAGENIGAAFEYIDLTDMRKQQSQSGVNVREFKIVGSNEKEVK